MKYVDLSLKLSISWLHLADRNNTNKKRKAKAGR